MNYKYLICIVFLLSVLLFLPGCKKKVDTVSGNWQGTLTISLSHQHEEYQEWEEIIESEDEDEPDTVIVHTEHITWSFTDNIVIQFRFSLSPPLYEAQINGEGDAVQDAAFTPPTQCQMTDFDAPGFKVSAFGSVDSTTFSLRVVPESIPVISVSHQCQNVFIRVPAYGTALLQALSNIHFNLPAQDGVSAGGSGTVSPGGGYTPMAYIYNLTLNQR
ncbi:MAG: hypothetical protein GY950_21925 [bacterium]|nr:hypothetical protein [bacterium]